MYSTETIKKQKLSLAKRYKLYLSKLPAPKDKLSNKYNLLDDLNIMDEAMMKEIRNYTSALSIAHAKQAFNLRNHKGEIMPKDRGRKAIKKPKQLKVKA